MGKIISVANEKGGVGKTTLTYNIALYAVTELNKKVLLVDVDPQCNLTDRAFGDIEKPLALTRKNGDSNVLSLFDDELYSLPVNLRPNLDIMGATMHISAKHACTQDEIANFAANINEVADKYDFVFIDSPPSVGDLQYSAMTSSWGVLVVSEAEADAIKGIDKVFNTVSKIRGTYNPNLQVIGIVFNKTRKQQTKVQGHLLSEASEKYGNLVFNTQVLTTTKMSEANTLNMSLFEYDADAAQHINLKRLVNELMERV